jgi:hypothetical protein
MSAFTTRVELHGATWSDYEKLHAEMRREGFSQTITDGTNGTVYELPPAEYNYEGPITRAAVLNKAKAAASRVKTENSVLVTESAGRTWDGLKPAMRRAS